MTTNGTGATSVTKVPRRLLSMSPEQQALESRRAREREAADRLSRREAHHVFWQCVGLAFAGVPIYVWSWHLTDSRSTQLATATAFVVSYGLPFFRWLAFYISRSEEFD